MSAKDGIPIAEAMDRHMRFVVLGMFLFSLKWAAAAATHLAGQEMAGYLNLASDIATGLGLAIILFALAWKLRRLSKIPRGQRRAFLDPDGYVADVFKKSCVISWSWTFVVLVFMEAAARKQLGTLPSEFFVRFSIFAMLAVFSVSFFIRSRGGEDDFDESQE